jgi:hypothetical protein
VRSGREAWPLSGAHFNSSPGQAAKLLNKVKPPNTGKHKQNIQKDRQVPVSAKLDLNYYLTFARPLLKVTLYIAAIDFFLMGFTCYTKTTTPPTVLIA